MSAYIIDTETTGEEPTPEVIELAIARMDEELNFTHVFEGRFKPTNRIKFSAMAVHHILPEELEDRMLSSTAKAQLPSDMEYMIGHNVDYDWNALGCPTCKRICTLAIARFIWPGNDGHSLGAMAYQLATNLKAVREALKGAHSAAADVELCYSVLRAMLENDVVQTTLQRHVLTAPFFELLWQFSEIARIPVYWSFGKFKGQRIEEADRGYLGWCLKQPDMDEYVKAACRRAMGLG